MKKIKIVVSFIIAIGVIFASCLLFNQTDFNKENETLVLSSGQYQSDADLQKKEQNQASPQTNLENNTVAKVETDSQEPLEEEKKENQPLNKCYITIKCDSIIEKSDFKNYKHISPDGIILSDAEIEFNDGETVFDVLLKATTQSNISIDYTKNPLYNSVYIKGINYLNEFDFGKFSGWMYKVNDVSPTKGCSQYKVNNCDRIEFYYNC